MKHGTKTFFLGERIPASFHFFVDTIEVRYCHYCGEKADTHKNTWRTGNHTHDSEIVHYCTCEEATKEHNIREEMDKTKQRLNSLIYGLSRLEESKGNDKARKMQFEHEVAKLRNKYKIAKDEVL